MPDILSVSGLIPFESVGHGKYNLYGVSSGFFFKICFKKKLTEKLGDNGLICLNKKVQMGFCFMFWVPFSTHAVFIPLHLTAG